MLQKTIGGFYLQPLVLENEYSVDCEVNAFIQDHREVFKKRIELLGCSFIPYEELIKEIQPAKALIISSTFMDTPQLEVMTYHLSLMESKHIFVLNLEDHMSYWFEETEFIRAQFQDYDLFISNLRRCILKHHLFSFFAYGEPSVNDLFSSTCPPLDHQSRCKYSYRPYFL